MLLKFDTDKMDRAKAALLLYGLYRSRDKNSSLSGMETWDRFNSYCRGACIKSSTIGEFIQNFCRKAGIGSIKPKYFSTGDPVSVDGELIFASDIKDYRTGILGDDSLLPVIGSETIYLIMLVRERIQREKMEYEEEEYED